MGRFVKFIKFFGAEGYLYGAGARVQGGGGEGYALPAVRGRRKEGLQGDREERAATIRKITS